MHTHKYPWPMFTTSELPSFFFNGEAADASLMTVLRGIGLAEN